ncbi:hypothetical protein ACFTAO_29765 [Paenibacillus rhizoplanae]
MDVPGGDAHWRRRRAPRPRSLGRGVVFGAAGGFRRRGAAAAAVDRRRAGPWPVSRRRVADAA